MGNLKSNTLTPKAPTGPIWKRFTIYVAVISTLAATPAMAIVGDGSGCGCIRPCLINNRNAEDQNLVSDASQTFITEMGEISTNLEIEGTDQTSVEDVETVGMLFSCWRDNFVEVGVAGCYQL